MTLYGIIGIICAIVDGAVFYFTYKNIGVYISNFISMNVGMILSFILNTFLNFKVKDNLHKRAGIFFAVGYTGLIVSMLIMLIGVDILLINEMPVKIFSVLFVAIMQFALNKLVTFRTSAT